MSQTLILLFGSLLFGTSPTLAPTSNEIAMQKCSRESTMPVDGDGSCKPAKKEEDTCCSKNTCNENQSNASEQAAKVRKSAAQKVIDGE